MNTVRERSENGLKLEIDTRQRSMKESNIDFELVFFFSAVIAAASAFPAPRQRRVVLLDRRKQPFISVRTDHTSTGRRWYESEVQILTGWRWTDGSLSQWMLLPDNQSILNENDFHLIKQYDEKLFVFVRWNKVEALRWSDSNESWTCWFENGES